MLGIPVPSLEAGVWIVASMLASWATSAGRRSWASRSAPAWGLRVLVAALAAMALGGFASMPATLSAAVAVGVLSVATGPAGEHRISFTDAVLAVVVVVGLVLRRFGRKRADRAEISSWQSSVEPRRVPPELRRLPRSWSARWLGGPSRLVARHPAAGRPVRAPVPRRQHRGAGGVALSIVDPHRLGRPGHPRPDVVRRGRRGVAAYATSSGPGLRLCCWPGWPPHRWRWCVARRRCGGRAFLAVTTLGVRAGVGQLPAQPHAARGSPPTPSTAARCSASLDLPATPDVLAGLAVHDPLLRRRGGLRRRRVGRVSAAPGTTPRRPVLRHPGAAGPALRLRHLRLPGRRGRRAARIRQRGLRRRHLRRRPGTQHLHLVGGRRRRAAPSARCSARCARRRPLVPVRSGRLCPRPRACWSCCWCCPAAWPRLAYRVRDALPPLRVAGRRGILVPSLIADRKVDEDAEREADAVPIPTPERRPPRRCRPPTRPGTPAVTVLARASRPSPVGSPPVGSTWPTTRCRCCSASTSTSREGEIIALLGTNGAGKSTLLQGHLRRRRRSRAARSASTAATSPHAAARARSPPGHRARCRAARACSRRSPSPRTCGSPRWLDRQDGAAGARARRSRRSSSCSRCCGSAATTRPATSPAASSRCWRWRWRSSASPSCSLIDELSLGPGAGDRRAAARHRRRPSATRAPRSSSSSSRSTWRSPSPTAPTSWRRARCGSRARPPSCSSGPTCVRRCSCRAPARRSSAGRPIGTTPADGRRRSDGRPPTRRAGPRRSTGCRCASAASPPSTTSSLAVRAGRDRRLHRPQRRRQDHAVRPHLRLHRRRRRRGRAATATTSPPRRPRPGPGRPRPLVPGRPAVPRPHRGRDHRRRPRALRRRRRPAQRRLPPAGRSRVRGEGRRRAGRRAHRPVRPRRLPHKLVARAVHRLPPHRRPGLRGGPRARRSCCSTSRRPGIAQREAEALGPLLLRLRDQPRRVAAGDRARHAARSPRWPTGWSRWTRARWSPRAARPRCSTTPQVVASYLGSEPRRRPAIRPRRAGRRQLMRRAHPPVAGDGLLRQAVVPIVAVVVLAVGIGAGRHRQRPRATPGRPGPVVPDREALADRPAPAGHLGRRQQGRHPRPVRLGRPLRRQAAPRPPSPT